MTEDKKVYRFCQGLKPQIRLEVMKTGAQIMKDASRVALNLDAALYGAGMFSFTTNRTQEAPVSMNIGNFEQHRRQNFQGACHRCKEEGCRPFICSPRNRYIPRGQGSKHSQANSYSGKE